MSSLFIATPKASHLPVEVATGTALKTLLQVATPATTGIFVMGWGISFDGTSPSAEPGVCQLMIADVAATVTSLTPEKFADENDEASLCIGGAALTGYNATAEGTITASQILDPQEVHPQSGYSIWFPDGKEPRVRLSRFLRVRATFPATVNAIPWIVFRE